jgi:hypothetical protein
MSEALLGLADNQSWQFTIFFGCHLGWSILPKINPVSSLRFIIDPGMCLDTNLEVFV